MAAHLGDGYHVIEEGLSARTTSADDPNDPRLNGSQYLPTAIASHLKTILGMVGARDLEMFGTEFAQLLPVLRKDVSR